MDTRATQEPEPLLPLPKHRQWPRQAERPAQARRIEAEQGEGGFEGARWCTDGRLTSARFANGLKSLGVQQGDVVGLHLHNLLQPMLAIQARNRIGAIHAIPCAGFSAVSAASRGCSMLANRCVYC